jgi:ribosome-binding factor A
MAGERGIKLASLIHQELAKIISKEIEFPLGMVVTVSEVEVSRDLSLAKIWIGVVPSASASAALAVLDGSRRRLQRKLNQRLSALSVPKIEFAIDRSGERAARLDNLLLQDKNR